MNPWAVQAAPWSGEQRDCALFVPYLATLSAHIWLLQECFLHVKVVYPTDKHTTHTEIHTHAPNGHESQTLFTGAVGWRTLAHFTIKNKDCDNEAGSVWSKAVKWILCRRSQVLKRYQWRPWSKHCVRSENRSAHWNMIFRHKWNHAVRYFSISIYFENVIDKNHTVWLKQIDLFHFLRQAFAKKSFLFEFSYFSFSHFCSHWKLILQASKKGPP